MRVARGMLKKGYCPALGLGFLPLEREPESSDTMCVEAAGPAGTVPSAATIMLQSLAVLVVLLGLAVTPARTQNVDFSSFRDSLSHIGDGAALRQLEAQRRPARDAS